MLSQSKLGAPGGGSRGSRPHRISVSRRRCSARWAFIFLW